MKKILCFGEILLRLSPDVNGNWLNSQSLPVYLGGAELNVANALANWNEDVAYCSAIPDNYMSSDILKHLSANRIDVTRMIRTGSRIGIYFLAQGTDLKNAGVIYDRAHSSTAELKPGQVNWDDVLQDVSWFHFSAITPAISEDLVAVCKEAVLAARRKNIIVSVDLNYRSKLWKWGKQPIDVMPDLVQHCNLVMGNIWAAEMMLGIPIEPGFDRSKNSYLEQARATSAEIIRRFPECTQVANTFRFDQQDSLLYYATLYSANGLSVSPEHNLHSIVDRVGSGDCFMAGLIYGSVHGLPEQGTLEFATAAAVDKMFVMGDATTSSPSHIMERVKKVNDYGKR